MIKKIGIIFVLFLIASIIVFYEPKKVAAETKMGSCKMEVEYFFLEAEEAGDYLNTPEDSKNGIDTKFEIGNLEGVGEITMTDIELKKVSNNITEKQLENYVEAIAKRDESLEWDRENEDAPAYCDGNTCLNSGDGVKGNVKFDMDDLKNTEGGTSGFIEKYMMTSNNSEKYDSSIRNNGISESGKYADITVSRDWETTSKAQSNGFRYNGKNWVFFPIVATVEITYPCEQVIEKQLCPASSSDGGGINAGCGGGSSSSIQVHDLSGSANKYTISIADIKDDSIDEKDKAVCSDAAHPSYEYGKAKGIFKQDGTLSVDFKFNGNNNYAGGGFLFNFDYEIDAEWSYCVDNLNTESDYQCVIETWDAFCESASAQGREEVDLIKDGSNYVCLYYDEETDYDEKSIPASGNCSELGKDWEKSGNQCRKEDGTKKVNKLTTSPKCAPVTLTVDASKCVNSSAAQSTIFKDAAKKYSGILEKSKDVRARDSNNANDKSMHSIDDYAGTLSGSSEGTGGEWAPGKSLRGSVGYTQYYACINIYTADVRYEKTSNISGNTVSSSNLDENGNAKSVCGPNEIDGGTLYYMPLRLKDKESFGMEASYTNASLLSGSNWTISASCSINANQKLDKYIYRPIDMSDPVPDTIENLKTTSVFPKREPGLNWTYFMKDINAINSKMNRNTPEYSVVLTNNDIINIKKYNETANYDYPVFNENVITASGYSNVLKQFGIENLIGTDNYNDLGKCKKDCW